MKSRTKKKHGHRFLQAVSLCVFEVTQAFTNKISRKKWTKERNEELLVGFLKTFTQSSERSASWTWYGSLEGQRKCVSETEKEIGQDTIIPAWCVTHCQPPHISLWPAVGDSGEDDEDPKNWAALLRHVFFILCLNLLFTHLPLLK